MPLFSKRSPGKAAAASGGAASDGGAGQAASAPAPPPPPPVEISPTALAFSSDPAAASAEQARTFTIANRSPTLSIAFKVKCSNRDAYVVDVASGVLGPLAARRVRVFRLATAGPPPSSASSSDAFCVTALALPVDTPLPEAAAAALTGRMGVGAADTLLPVVWAKGLLEGGPPPVPAALAGAVGAAGGVTPLSALGPLLQAFSTLLAARGLVDDLGGALSVAGEVAEAAAAAAAAATQRTRRGRGGGGSAAAVGPASAAASPPTPTPAEEDGGGGRGGDGGDEGDTTTTPTTTTVGTPPGVSAVVPAFAERVALFEGGGL